MTPHNFSLLLALAVIGLWVVVIGMLRYGDDEHSWKWALAHWFVLIFLSALAAFGLIVFCC